jgi:hypothetical protein
MKFRTVAQAIESHPRVFATPGEREKTLYSPSFDEFGHMELKEAGKENLYEFVQSHKESTDIHVILARFVNGDTSALARRQMFYADLTDFPTTYADVVNTMHGAEDYFTHLPVEVRAKFGHDFNRFLASLDNPQTLVDLGLLADHIGEAAGGAGSDPQLTPATPTVESKPPEAGVVQSPSAQPAPPSTTN